MCKLHTVYLYCVLEIPVMQCTLQTCTERRAFTSMTCDRLHNLATVAARAPTEQINQVDATDIVPHKSSCWEDHWYEDKELKQSSTQAGSYCAGPLDILRRSSNVIYFILSDKTVDIWPTLLLRNQCCLYIYIFANHGIDNYNVFISIHDQAYVQDTLDDTSTKFAHFSWFLFAQIIGVLKCIVGLHT